MAETRFILTVEMQDQDCLRVMFSDGTVVGYSAKELLKLRQLRVLVDEPSGSGRPTTIVTKTRFIVCPPTR